MPELTADQLREISKNLREVADAFRKLAAAFAVTTVSIEDQADLDRWETEGGSYEDPEDRPTPRLVALLQDRVWLALDH